MNKLFVTNLPCDITEKELYLRFVEYGEIISLDVPRTRNRKGCAFISFSLPAYAFQAVNHLNGVWRFPTLTQPMKLEYVDNLRHRDNKVFIGQIPKTFSEETLHSLFICYGEIREIHIHRDTTGSPKGNAFIKFFNIESALVAIEDMNGMTPLGATRRLNVKFADDKKLQPKSEFDIGHTESNSSTKFGYTDMRDESSPLDSFQGMTLSSTSGLERVDRNISSLNGGIGGSNNTMGISGMSSMTSGVSNNINRSPAVGGGSIGSSSGGGSQFPPYFMSSSTNGGGGSGLPGGGSIIPGGGGNDNNKLSMNSSDRFLSTPSTMSVSSSAISNYMISANPSFTNISSNNTHNQLHVHQNNQSSSSITTLPFSSMSPFTNRSSTVTDRRTNSPPPLRPYHSSSIDTIFNNATSGSNAMNRYNMGTNINHTNTTSSMYDMYDMKHSNIPIQRSISDSGASYHNHLLPPNNNNNNTINHNSNLLHHSTGGSSMSSHSGNNSNTNMSMSMSMSSHSVNPTRLPHYMMDLPGMNNNTNINTNANNALLTDNSPIPKGPPGANLFIRHLPKDFTDEDLATLFTPFGRIVSATVFVDMDTSISRGFGFVSYDSIRDAESAIQAMNGFNIGGKRLRVEHKTNKTTK